MVISDAGALRRWPRSRRFLRSLFAVGALVLPGAGIAVARPPRVDPVARVRTLEGAGQWEEARQACDEILRSLLVDPRRRKSELLLPNNEGFAELLTRCAGAEQQAGHADRAAWLWHEAQLFDGWKAVAVAGSLSGALRLPALRRAGHPGDGGAAEPSPSSPPVAAGGLSSPMSARDLIAAGPGCELRVELWIDAGGRTREPVLLDQRACSTVQVLALLDAFERRRYRPATCDGAPCAARIKESVTIGPRFRWD